MSRAWMRGRGAGARATLRWRAFRRLGSAFRTEVSPIADGRLVRDGLYARLRHPSETGLWGALLGVLLVTGAGRTACVAVPVFLALTWARLRLEERALIRQFGAEYEAYRRDVPALVPFRFRR